MVRSTIRAIELDAVHAGHTTVCKLLLEEGADVEQRNVVCKHCMTDRVRCDNAALQMKESPLLRSAHNGHLKTVKFLIGQGADVNAVDMVRARLPSTSTDTSLPPAGRQYAAALGGYARTRRDCRGASQQRRRQDGDQCPREAADRSVSGNLESRLQTHGQALGVDARLSM